MLLTADFERSGPDLVIIGKDGATVVVRDYFSMNDAPDLATAGGAVLPAELVGRLAGALAPGQVAQAGGGLPGGEPIGEVTEVQGGVRIQRADGTIVDPVEAGTPIYADDLIQTEAGGSVGLLFIDDTSFSLGANARMVIDELVFDPAGASRASFNIVQGAFSFISGEIASAGPNAMTVTTPVATIGIRGTQVTGRAAAEGEETVIVLLPESDGTVGEILVTNAAGQVLLTLPNEATTILSQFAPPGVPTVLPVSIIQEQFGTNLQILPPQGTQRFQNNTAPERQENNEERSGGGQSPEGAGQTEGEPQQEAEAGPGTGEPGQNGPGELAEAAGEKVEQLQQGEGEKVPGEQGLAQNADGKGSQLAGGPGSDKAFTDGAAAAAQQGQGAKGGQTGQGAGESLSGSFGGTAFQGFTGSVGSTGATTTTLGGQGQATETTSASGSSSSGSGSGLGTASGGASQQGSDGITVILGGSGTTGQAGIGGGITTDENSNTGTGTVISGPGTDTGFTPNPGGGTTLNVLSTVTAFVASTGTAAGLSSAFTSGGRIQNMNVGTSAADQVFGSTGNDLLIGGSGGDVLVGGHGEGDDILIGGSSVSDDDSADDTITYHSTNNGVVVTLRDLAEGYGTAHSVGATLTGTGDDMTESGGEIGIDRIFGIEHIDGGKGNDTITGNSGVNILRGGNMSDAADMGMGDDTLDGGAGADTLIGGIGNDSFIFDTSEFYEYFDEGGSWDYVAHETTETIQGGDGHDTLLIRDDVYGLNLDAYKDNFDSIEEIRFDGGEYQYAFVTITSSFVSEVSSNGTLTVSSNQASSYNSLTLGDGFEYDGSVLGSDEALYRRFVAADGATLLVSQAVEITDLENHAPQISVTLAEGEPASGMAEVPGYELQVSNWSQSGRMFGFKVDDSQYSEQVDANGSFSGEPQFVVQLNPNGSASIRGDEEEQAYQILTDGSGNAILLNPGALVGPNAVSGIWSGEAAQFAPAYPSQLGFTTYYVAIRMETEAGYQYGWLELSYEYTQSDGTIYRVDPKAVYYNDTPEGDIAVGRSDLTTGIDTVEDAGAITLSGITISDQDDGDGNLEVTVTLSVSDGTLSLNGSVAGGVSGADIVQSGPGTIVITASLASINATLQAGGLAYTADANFAGSDYLHITVNDQDNAGAGNSLTASQVVAINVAGVNDAPVLSGELTLVSIQEDSGPSAPGKTLGESLAALVSDGDEGSSVAGIAIYSNDTDPVTEGVWQYSTDGQNWVDVPAELSDASALLVGADARVRFNPVVGFNGTPTSLGFYAVDDSYVGDFSSGLVEGEQYANVSVRGGATPFSADASSIAITVIGVNDQPEITITEPGTALFDATSGGSGALLSSAQTNDFSVNASSSFTFEARINPSTLSTGSDGYNEQAIFQLNRITGGAISVSINSDGALVLRDTNIVRGTSSDGLIEAGSWQHVAFVFQPGSMAIYINGELAETLNGIVLTGNHATALFLGGRSDYSMSFDGQMDDVRLWNDARSAAEIADHYAAPVDPQSENLQANYTFDAVGQTIVDVTGNGHDLTNDGVTQVGGSYAIIEGGTLAVTGISVADADGDTLTVVLSSETGTLDVSGSVSGGLAPGAIAGGGTGSVTLTGTAAQINATLADASGLIFSHDGSEAASAVISVQVRDDSGEENDTAYGALTLSVTNANDAPELAGNANLVSFEEDGTPSYQAVAQLFSGIVADEDNPEAPLAGIAIVGNAADSESQGEWEFSTDGRESWSSIPTDLSNGAAVILPASAVIRFVPLENYNGAAPALTVRAIDSSYAGSYSDSYTGDIVEQSVVTNGGTTPYSANTGTIGVNVDPVNDAPEIGYQPPNVGELFDDIGRSMSGDGLGSGDFGLVVNITDPTDTNPDLQAITRYFAVRKQPSDPGNQLMLELVADSAGPIRFRVDNYKEPVAVWGEQTIDANFGGGGWHYEAFVPSPATDRLVAFRIDLGDGNYEYGWLRYTATTDEITGARGFTLEELAYSDIPNVGILAGSADLDMDLSVTEGGTLVVEGLSVGDIDGDTLTVVLSSENGSLDIKTNVAGGLGAGNIAGQGTGAVTLTGSAAAINATLADSAGVIFTHDGDDDDYEATLSVTVNDGSGEQNASASQDFYFEVNGVNDAPHLNGDGNLTAFGEDATPSYKTVDQLFGSLYSDDDPEASLNGVAVVGNSANAATEGSWQFSTDGGSSWVSIPTGLGDANAVILHDATKIRFQPVVNYNGTPPVLTVRAVDGSYSGDYSNSANDSVVQESVAVHGGTTPFSSETGTIGVTVNPTNDTPAISFAEHSGVNFDGNGDYILVPGNAAYETVGNGFTIEAWIRPEQPYVTSSTLGIILSTNTIQGGSRDGFSLGIDSSGRLVMYLTNNDNGNGSSMATVTANEWQHVAVSFDNTSNQVKLYINGEEAYSGPNSMDGYLPGGNPLVIGAERRFNGTNFFFNRWFNGDISEVGLFNRAITAGEAADHYANSLNGNESGLIGYWPLDEGSGSTAEDHSSIGNDGALNGNAAFFAGAVDASLAEGGSLSIAPVTITDIDGDTGVVTVTLSVSNGTLDINENVVGGVGAGGITGDNTAAITLTGTLAAINTTLNRAGSLVYTHVGETTSDTLYIIADDGSGAPNAYGSQSLALTITPVNDAPHLTGNADLNPVSEDTNAILTGQTVSSLFGALVSDDDTTHSFLGVAVIGNDADAATEGVWQYSDGGETWRTIGTDASSSGALMLSADTAIRFVPAANFSGIPPALVVRAVDDSYLSSPYDGGFSSTLEGDVGADLTSYGGSTPFSDNTATLGVTVTPVNDAPQINVAGQLLANIATFDGTGDAVRANAISGYDDWDSSGFTIEAWIKPDNPPAANSLESPFIAGTARYVSDVSNANSGISLALQRDVSTGAYRIALHVMQASSATGVHSTISVSLDEWQHIGASYDPASDTVRFYLNGELAETKTNVTLPQWVPADGNALVIGAQAFYSMTAATYSYAHGFAGSIADVRVYNTAVDANTIAERYDQSLTGSETGLVGWYPMNGGDGVAADSSNVGNHGYLAGNAALDGVVQYVQEGGSIAVSGFSITDIDAGDGTITATLSAAHGSFTVSDAVAGGVGSAGIVNNGADGVTLTGTLAEIDATLGGSNAVIFNHDGTEETTTTITLSVSDEGNTGEVPLGASAIKSYSVDPTNDAPTILAGFGNGLDLNGTDQSANSATAGYSSGGDFSVESWVTWRGDNGSHANQVIYSNGNMADSAAAGVHNGFAIAIVYDEDSGTNRIALRVVTDASTGAVSELVSLAVMPTGAATHIAVTQAEGNWQLYVDGVHYLLGAATPDSMTSNMSVGAYSGEAAGYFNGVIDDLRLWNAVRSQQEIQDNRFRELSGDEAYLKDYFTFNATGADMGQSSTAESESVLSFSNVDTQAASPSDIPLLQLTEGGTMILRGITVNDVEANQAEADLTVVLTAEIGKFWVDVESGVSVSGNNSSAITLTGDAGSLNALLSGSGGDSIGLSATTGASGTYNLTVSVSDGGVSGAGGVATTTTTLSYTYTAQDDTNWNGGASLQFDGNDLAVAGGAGDFNFSGDFTLEMMVNPQDTTQSTLLDTRAADGTNGVVLAFDEAGNLYFAIIGEANGEPTAVTTVYDETTNFTHGEWAHIAVSVDRDAGITLYVNGEEIAARTINTAAADFSGLGGLRLGLDYEGGDGFKGQMDEIRIWEEARSPVQIAEFAYRQVDPSTTNLMAYWNGSEAAGGVMQDQTGHGYDAVLGGGLGHAHAPHSLPNVGVAVSLDGVDDKLTLATGDFAGASQGTWSLWFRSEGDWAGDNESGTQAALMSIGNPQDGNEGIALLMDDQGNIIVKVSDENGVVHTGGTGFVAAGVNDGLWHNVSVTYGKSEGDEIGIYVDGVLSSSFKINAAWDFAAGAALVIGASDTGYYEEFRGEIAEFAVWTRQLDATEIDMLSLEGVEIGNDGLAVWQTFDDATLGSSVHFDDYAGGVQTELDVGAEAPSAFLQKLVDVDAPVMGQSGSNYDGLIQTGQISISDFAGTNFSFTVNGEGSANTDGFIHVDLGSDRGHFYLQEETGRWYYLPGNFASSGVPPVTITVSDGSTTEAMVLALSVTAYDSAVSHGGTTLQFDSNDYASFGRGPSDQLAVSGNLTVEFWVNATASADGPIVRFGPDPAFNPNGTASNVLYEIGVNAQGNIYFTSQDAAQASQTITFDAFTLDPSKWQQISVVRDVEGDTLSLYVNGAFVQAAEYAADPFDGSESVLVLGGDGFVGAVDELRVWADARSASEIRTHYDHALSGDESGLVGYWHMDEVDGTILFDASGGGAHGTLGPADYNAQPDYIPNFAHTLVTGEADSGLYVENNASLNGLTAFTIEAWVRQEGGEGEMDIVHKGADGEESFRLFVDGTALSFMVTDGESDFTTTLSDAVELDQWTHVALRYDNGEISFFINGEWQKTANAYGVDGVASSLAGLSIGGPEYPFDGQIADVRLWNDARTDAEIAGNYLAPLADPAGEGNLIGYWVFDGDTGATTVADLSGSGNDAAVAGHVWFTDGMVMTYDDTIRVNEDGVAYGRWVAQQAGADPAYSIQGGITEGDWSVKTTAAGTMRIHTSSGEWVFNPAAGMIGDFSGTNGFRFIANDGTQQFLSPALSVAISDLPDVQALVPNSVLYFDGNDHLLTDYNPNLDIGAERDFTVEAWVWSKPGTSGTVFSTGNLDGTAGFTFAVEDGHLSLLLEGNTEFVSSDGSVASGEWQHVAFSWDRDGGLTFYVNGAAVGSYDAGAIGGLSATDFSSGLPAMIGNSRAGADGFDGYIDEVRVWTTARTETEIAANFARQVDGRESGLEGYWRFDDVLGGYGDQTGNAHAQKGAQAEVQRFQDLVVAAGKFYELDVGNGITLTTSALAGASLTDLKQALEASQDFADAGISLAVSGDDLVVNWHDSGNRAAATLHVGAEELAGTVQQEGSLTEREIVTFTLPEIDSGLVYTLSIGGTTYDQITSVSSLAHLANTLGNIGSLTSLVSVTYINSILRISWEEEGAQTDLVTLTISDPTGTSATTDLEGAYAVAENTPSQVTHLTDAIYLDGSGQIATDISTEIQGDYTVAGWFRVDTLASTQNLVSNADGDQLDFRVYVGTDGAVHFEMGNGTATPEVDRVSAVGAVEAGEWHHFAISYDDSGQMRAYLDGNSLGAISFSNGSRYSPGTGLVFGAFDGASMTGALDDLSVWSTMLDQTAVQSLMEGAPNAWASGLEAYYSFTDTDGMVAVDGSYNGNDGTITGGMLEEAGFDLQGTQLEAFAGSRLTGRILFEAGDTLSINDGPENGSSSLTVNTETGEWSFVAGDDIGSYRDSFSFQVTDSSGHARAVTYSVDVTAQTPA